MSDEDEFEESKSEQSDLSKLAFVAIIAFVLGASVVGLLLFDSNLDEPVAGGLMDEPDCLQSVDLNRDDVLLGMIYGRHCESIGLVSGAFWQEDAEGRKYAMPICIEPVEEGA